MRDTHDDHDHHNKMSTDRLEAFSDAVMAIIITITVLDFKLPVGASWSDLVPLIPLFITYAISFQTVGTYWNNHHHLLRATSHISAGMMWANLGLLFCLSFVPFATGWLGTNHGGAVPTAFYAFILFLCATAYFILQFTVVFHAENRNRIAADLRQSWKGRLSLLFYAAAVGCAFVNTSISDLLIILVALMWFIPDRRIARNL